MKYSDFLKANEMTHEDVAEILRRDDPKLLRALWGRAVAKTNPPDWIKPKIEKGLKDPMLQKKGEGLMSNFGIYELVSQEIGERLFPDDNDLYLATLDSWRRMEHQKVDEPNIEKAYTIEGMM